VSAAQLKRLRASLPYTGGQAKIVLHRMIAGLEAELSASRDANPGGTVLGGARSDAGASVPPSAGREGEDSGQLQCHPARATVADPEPKPPEAHSEAVDGAGSSSEANARQSHPAAGGRSGARGEDDGQKRASAAGAGGSPASQQRCKICNAVLVQQPLEEARYFAKRRYCGKTCRKKAELQHKALATERRRARQPQVAAAIAPAAADPSALEHRQKSPYHTTRGKIPWVILRSIVIGPGRPAPVKLGPDGKPLPFRDDLDAIADRGSLAALSRPAPWHSAGAA
jgi:hypothetical protein